MSNVAAISADEAERELERLGIIASGHFVDVNGNCVNRWLDQEAVTTYPDLLRRIAKSMADTVRERGLSVDVVACARMWEIGLGIFLANELGARFLPLPPKDKRPRLSLAARELLENANVLVSDNAGLDVRPLAETLSRLYYARAQVVAVSSLWSYAPNSTVLEDEPPRLSFIAAQLPPWGANACPEHSRAAL